MLTLRSTHHRPTRSLWPAWLRTLAAFALAWLPAATFAAVNNPEIEPNDSKAAATVCSSGGAGMAALDTISGTTTGGGGTGTGSADYFLIKTASRPAGVYKYQLVLTSATPGHTISIRGLSQVGGVITAGTDVAVQTGAKGLSGQPTDSRTVQWYGVGRQEQIYVQVTGTSSTTSSYSMQLQVTNISPTPLAGGVFEGSVSIGRGGGNGNDVDFWMYSSSFASIANYGNDRPNSLTRTYTPGVYYIAIGDSNTANASASPSDDGYRDANVLDFPDAIVNATVSSSLNMNVQAVSGWGTATGTGTKVNPFDVNWYCFQVVPNTISTVPQGSITTDAMVVSNCGDEQVCFQVAVSPGQNPASNILSVTLNLSALQGPTSAQLFDDGLHCDGAANNLVFGLSFTIPTGAQPGTYALPFTIRDERGRSSTGQLANFTVVGCSTAPPTNDDCASAISLVPNAGPVLGTTRGATADTNAPNCAGGQPSASPGVWYKTVGTGNLMTARTCLSDSRFDSVVQVYCATNGCQSLSCIAAGNDDCGKSASATWCSELGASYLILVRGNLSTDRGPFRLELLDGGVPCFDALSCLPQGACCTPGGCIQTSRPACDAQGGTYQGDGAACQQPNFQVRWFSTANFPLPIPDNSTTGTQASITVPSGSGTIGDLAVLTSLRHPFAGNITVTLTRGSTTVTLLDRPGRVPPNSGDSSGLQGDYMLWDSGSSLWTAAATSPAGSPIPSGAYAPSRANDGLLPSPSLSAFNGQPWAGTWVLKVRDGEAGNTGYLTGFKLVDVAMLPVCASPCPVCPPDFNQDGGVDGSDIGAFIDAWQAGDSCADVNQDGGVDGSDVVDFWAMWQNGSC